MKKQIFIVAFAALALPTALCARYGSGAAPAREAKNPEIGPKTGPKDDSGSVTVINTSAALVAAFPGSEADIAAGAYAAAPQGGNANSAAGKAATAFVQQGFYNMPGSSKQSARLGRLGAK